VVVGGGGVNSSGKQNLCASKRFQLIAEKGLKLSKKVQRSHPLDLRQQKNIRRYSNFESLG